MERKEIRIVNVVSYEHFLKDVQYSISEVVTHNRQFRGHTVIFHHDLKKARKEVMKYFKDSSFYHLKQPLHVKYALGIEKLGIVIELRGENGILELYSSFDQQPFHEENLEKERKIFEKLRMENPEKDYVYNLKPQQGTDSDV